jgi:dynamin family protein
MIKHVLEVKYHPVNKEISFKRFQDKNELEIKSNGILGKYINKKGDFILQFYGKSFFDDIAKAFDGIKEVEIQAIMTKLDYEDFEQMVDDYNKQGNNECTFTPTLFEEIPSMEKTYEHVKELGLMAIDILEDYRGKLFDIPHSNTEVKKSIEGFAKEINEEIKNLKTEITSNNNVNLCFAGAYSSGKSSLINALLGYRILPEAIGAETAKIFMIKSPKEANKERISFILNDINTEIQWNDKTKVFEFKNAPSENNIRKEVQNFLNEAKQNRIGKYIQIYNILKILNENMNISSKIELEFPIPLDTKTVQFTIYDTPGTDSDNIEHQTVLQEALKDQKQSILILVIEPTKLEGTANRVLLNYLKDIGKTNIDISRSIVVINKADTISFESRESFQSKSIKKEDIDFAIELKDKKLFFISALYGYYEKAKKNGALSEKENEEIEERMPRKFDTSTNRYFIQNRCANSEYATNAMIKRCEYALEEARKNNDELDIIEICSGLFSLETEILQYGEKYAPAVKVSNIADIVNNTLSRLNNKVSAIIGDADREISTIEKEIKDFRKEFIDSIDREYNNRTIPKGKMPNKEISVRLRIDSDKMEEYLYEPLEDYLNNKIERERWLFIDWGVNYDKAEKIKSNIVDYINNTLIGEYVLHFKSEREKILNEERDMFIDFAKNSINKGDISNVAKNYILDIPKVNIVEYRGLLDIENVYKDNMKNEKILFFIDNKKLDRENFIEDVKKELRSIATYMTDNFCDDYTNSLNYILAKIKTNFEKNIDDYALIIKAKIGDKDAMKKLQEKIENVANDLKNLEDDLKNIILKEN